MTVSVVDRGPGQVSRSALINAPAKELFDIVADPRRHSELDGSGTVRDNVSAPPRLEEGAKFSTRMTMYGVPYRITSRITAYEENRLVEWRHPLGHRWRWEFVPVDDATTAVTETFDYGSAGRVKNALRYYQLTRFTKANAAGIEATLTKLQDRFAAAASG